MAGLHAAVANMINSRHNGLVEQAKKDFVDLALLSSVPDLMENVEQMEKETEEQLEIMNCTKGYGCADKVDKKIRRLRYIDQRNTVMLKMVISLSAR